MYNNLLSYIYNRIYDNGNGEITPTKVRQVFQQCLSELGSDANFMGIANPNTPPAASPDNKQMYVALPANFKRTFQGFGVGGSNYTLAAGRFAIFYYDSDQWNRAIMVVNGTTSSPIDSRQRVILEPVLTPITRRILADDSRVVTMTYDGADIDPTDSVDLDSSQHVVTFTIDDPTFSGVLPADTLDGAFGTWVLPEGIRTLANNQTGVTASAVVLPTTCTEIATGAIESLAVTSLTLTGAPPTLDSQIDWSNVTTLTIPSQYAMLYQREDWLAVINTIVAAGGTVNSDSGTPYNATPQMHSYRTPSSAEWTYLLNTRSASTVGSTPNARYAKAQVNGINGLIILPDVFTLPTGLSMTNINTANAAFSGNTYTIADWQVLEDAGCVFLPATGYRNGSTVSGIASNGFYSASDVYNENANRILWIISSSVAPSAYELRNVGKAVRCIDEAKAGFTIAAGVSVGIAKGNLQYRATTDEWRFAPHAYDVIGADNANISPTYNGWIDLFGWGTSGAVTGATANLPTSTSTTNTDYYPLNSATQDLTGAAANADWGVYNNDRIQDQEGELSLHHSVLAANATSVAFGASPEYQILPMTSDLTVKITAINNSEKNYVLIYPTDGTFHEVTVQLDSGLSGYTLIGELKSMPTGEYAPFSGTPNITVNNVTALELAVVRSGSYIVISWSLVGYKS